MNLNQIIPGTDYVLLPYRGRGEEFRWDERLDTDRWVTHVEWQAKYHVYRVKAMRAYSEREEGAKRDTGYVDVFWLDREGNFKYDDNNEYVIKKVRVRDIATIWDEYEDELEFQKVKKETRLKEEQAQYERRQREREERQEREQREYEARIERQRIEREEQERQARLERERIEQERRNYADRIEGMYKLPTGSVIFNGNGQIELNKELIDLDLSRGFTQ